MTRSTALTVIGGHRERRQTRVLKVGVGKKTTGEVLSIRKTRAWRVLDDVPQVCEAAESGSDERLDGGQGACLGLWKDW